LLQRRRHQIYVCPERVNLNTEQSDQMLDGATLSAATAKSDPPQSPYDVLLRIATEALCKARERGYTPGYERQDWLNAERKILARADGLTGSAC
jgi:hypothetical protein